jgi:hypothetical protein
MPMQIIMNLVAALDYPSGPIMGLATLACGGFIFGGGWLFKRADERAKAERAALKAAIQKSADGDPTNP